MKMNRHFIASVSLLLCAWLLPTGIDAQTSYVPQFRDYPAISPLIWLPSAPDLSTPEEYKYRTRITKASKQSANFAGHHVLASWGCGAECVTGVILDLPTGKVTFLPTVCCWGTVDDKFNPIEFRPDSRLVVFSGLLYEQGENSAHFFEFKDGRLLPIATIQRGRGEMKSAAVTSPFPQAAASESTYSKGVQAASQADDDRDPHFMHEFAALAKVRVGAAEGVSGWPADYAPLISQIQESGGFASYRATQMALSFLARGGVFMPIQSTRGGSTFVIYHPVADVGLLLGYRAGATVPDRGLLVPGEILRSDRIYGDEPPWVRTSGTLVDHIRSASEAIRSSNAKSYAKATSTLDPVADYTATLRANGKFRLLARDRLFASGMIANNAQIPCGTKFDAIAGTVEDMRRADGRLDIDVDPGMSTATYAVGGAVGPGRGVKIYALRQDPYILLAVWFDLSGGNCQLERIVAMSVFAQK
ncbi:hypothetical protein DNX69_15575 [Rhodopseudomonas palustris]|uniref:Uncharacterized protein n=1 Tax=Rhodopseudomonas palustris TaxID=1076 RepID=A0A323UIG8_RHOPL|nr:hypothetical protein [Rhodopseudomonas palustris]PZA10766.1 hypothetical protein DNX69_15575 [Rhodopseudomonas palustris]